MAADPGPGSGCGRWAGTGQRGDSAGMVAAAVSAAVKAGATAVQLDAVTATAIRATTGRVPRAQATRLDAGDDEESEEDMKAANPFAEQAVEEVAGVAKEESSGEKAADEMDMELTQDEEKEAADGVYPVQFMDGPFSWHGNWQA